MNSFVTPTATETQPAGQPQPGATETSGTASAETANSEPAAPLTVAQQFHPDLDPAKVEMSFENGKLRLKPRTTDVPAQVEADPRLDQATTTQPQPTPAAQSPTDEMTQLRGQVAQIAQAVVALMNGIQPGQPGQSTAPQLSAEPDYSTVDVYDPASLASFIRDTVRSAVEQTVTPHVKRVDDMAAQTQFDQAIAKYGREALEARAPLLTDLAKANPTLSLQQLWEHADKLTGPIPITQPAAAPKPATAQPATRTISSEQARQKAEQAQRLPAANSGVKAAGAAPTTMPGASIKNFGEQLLFNLMNASRGGN
ncbi:MAG TPA: hypothetical protein VJ302_16805 [Blastocatellia bacterium]|nr:hypothetical protein [Blastocatellia bacterium]